MRRILMRVSALLAGLLVISVAALLWLGATYEPNITIPEGMVGEHLDVNGIPLRVHTLGRGRDVLFIHGSPGSIEDWAAVMPGLEPEARVTAYDRPGHGYSGDSGDYSLANNANVALGVIRALGMKDVVVVGHSYGGATALALARHAPKEVAGYVIVDSAVYAPIAPLSPGMRSLAAPMLGLGLSRVFAKGLAVPRIRAGLREAFRGRDPGATFTSLRTRMWATPKVSHTTSVERTAYANYLAAQSQEYARISSPVHILAQNDGAERARQAERLHREVRGSVLSLLDDTGHYIQFERTSEVLDAVRALLVNPYLHRIRAQRAAWEKTAPASYTLTLNPPHWLRHMTGMVRIVVENGEVRQAVGSVSRAEVPPEARLTVDDVFAWAERAATSGPSRMPEHFTATFDPELHYPLSVQVDPQRDLEDDEERMDILCLERGTGGCPIVAPR